MAGNDMQLKTLREQIDELDTQLIKLIEMRMQHSKKVGKYKQVHELPALDEDRWKQASAARLEQARKLGLPETFVSELYELIHRYTLQAERDLGAK
jgi:chorismate mutase